ncbi:MAG TPA: hypothetical protein VFI17_13220 [Solirubrobacterales bacterium]|nr:hypothetical protein [Solirubrobacterales bacterium]
MGRAMAHPTRIGILMSMNAPRRRLSPRMYADETGERLANSSYHFRELEKFGCIELVGTQPVRGATEHFYEPSKRAMAWTKAWKALPDWIKQNLSATALRGLVEAVGEAIDAGTFEAREDAHLSFDAIRVDEQAWRELTALFNGTLENAIAIGERAEKRLSTDNPGFVATYGLTCFEAPPKLPHAP